MNIDLHEVWNKPLDPIFDQLPPAWRALVADTHEHYRLLSWLAKQFKHSTFLDLGTNRGFSALALASQAKERENLIITADLVKHQERLDFWDIPIHSFQISCNHPYIHKFIPESQLIFLDIDHEGVEETKFYRECLKRNYKGLLILDDIWTPQDREKPEPLKIHPLWQLWESIEVRKFDLTPWCHWSGTGVVDFTGELTVTLPDGKNLDPV